MSDTRTLLSRISSFRERLEQTPNLIPVGTAIDEPGRVAAAIAADPAWMGRSLRALAGSSITEGPLPVRLTARARRLLEDARGLVGLQRQMSDDPLLGGLALTSEPDPLVMHHRETVALTEAALRMVQAFPDSADVQLRICDGVEAMFRAVKDRLAVGQGALQLRKRDAERIDGLAKRLADLAAGRAVDVTWIGSLAEKLLDEARQAASLRFYEAEVLSTSSYPDGPASPAPARFVAAHALTVAQVVARIVSHDYEWASRPVAPVMTALLMDVGMTRIPPTVLGKTGPLTAEDRRLIDAHPQFAATLIRNVFPDAEVVADAVAAHHERPDGTGYPNARVGEDIPSLARLLSVCDTYAAMAVDRPHRRGVDPRTALTDTLIAAEQGRLDRDFSEYLLHLAFHPVGTVVELTDGRAGVVVANHTNRMNLRATARPVVALLTDVAGNVLPRPEFLDLAAANTGGVGRVLNKAERIALFAREYPELCG